MPELEVDGLHEVKLAAGSGNPRTIKNITSPTVYYRYQPGVSSTTKDGELAENESLTTEVPVWLICKAATSYSTSGEKAVLQETIPAAVIPGRREIESVSSVLKEGEAVGVYVTEGTVKEWKKMTALKLTTAENTSLNYFYYDPKLYEVQGKPSTLTLEMLVMSNATASTASYIAGIYKFSKAEGEKKHEVTVEAVVAASTAEIVTPAAKVVVQKSVTFPSSALTAGAYVLGFETITATTAAKSAGNITLTVFASN